MGYLWYQLHEQQVQNNSVRHWACTQRVQYTEHEEALALLLEANPQAREIYVPTSRTYLPRDVVEDDLAKTSALVTSMKKLKCDG
jgi:hypothetical protein